MGSKQALTYFVILLILLTVTLSSIFIFQQRLAAPPTSPTPPHADVSSDEEEGIRQAILKAIEEEREAALALLLYETKIEDIRISSQDRNWATAWLVPLDPETGEVVPVEPGMAILHKEEGSWQAFLPSNPLWAIVVLQVPDDLISPQEKSAWAAVSDVRLEALPSAPVTGYYLPWVGGEEMALTQSTHHDRYTPSGNAHYAFDFATVGYPSKQFNVHAAKAGTVSRAVWKHPNGDPNNGNYLVLEDITTSPTTYQLYLHFAQDSIPPELRVIGTHVQRGQFIGVADDTGVSSGNHLHFHVHTYPYYYWSTSIDITFMDVSINGGRPRIKADLPYCTRSTDVCDQTQYIYVSGNYLNPDHTPPQGGIESPSHGITVSTDGVVLAGWATDDNSGLAGAQFIAHYNGSWHNVGESFTTNTFVTAWDMCADQVPDGPVSLALEVRDKAGNKAQGLPGLRHFTKNYICPSPPPACVPNADQVALFADKDFQGTCVLLNAGIHGTPAFLGVLGDDNVVSIQVGSNVQATLFMDSGLEGRGETFLASDSNLEDNRIGRNTVSSVRVQPRGDTPTTPALVWPAQNAIFSSDSSIVLVWDEAGGGTQYQARLLLNGSQIKTTTWQDHQYWHLSSLSPGSYSWQVKAQNGLKESGWTSARLFEVEPSTSSPSSPVPAPFTDTMENLATNWTHSNYWDLTDEINHTPEGMVSWMYDTGSEEGYDTGEPNAGYLTSPPISIPGTGEYFLRFWYLYETEGPGVHWDQRWVQISVDSGEFENMVQLSDDAPNYWLRSPVISLADYAGQTIRVRFYFATLDDAFNAYRGWFIDDFSITSNPPPVCNDSDDSFVQAKPISYGSSVDAVICPGGDIDYYKFQGFAGDQIGAWTEAQVNGSPLDTHLSLLDIDGASALVVNDDQVAYERTDSSLSYRLSRTGTYYLKVRSWDHQTSGDGDHSYTLHLVKDDEDPIASFIYPREGQGIPPEAIMLRVSAEDAGSGVSRVSFLGHSSDWQGSDWILLGDDWDGSDGWNLPFNAKNVSNLSGIAFYAFVYDWAGNSIGTGAWNLRPPTLFFPLIVK